MAESSAHRSNEVSFASDVSDRPSMKLAASTSSQLNELKTFTVGPYAPDPIPADSSSQPPSRTVRQSASRSKRWRITAYENAFVVEPNLKFYKRDIDDLGRAYGKFTQIDEGPPQLLLYKESGDIVEVPHSSHCGSLSSSFGRHQAVVHCDALLGLMHMREYRFLVAVTESGLVASLPQDLSPTIDVSVEEAKSFGSLKDIVLEQARELFPEYRHVWCVTKSTLIPFHVPTDLYVASLAPSDIVSLCASTSTSIPSSPVGIYPRRGDKDSARERRLSTPAPVAPDGRGDTGISAANRKRATSRHKDQDGTSGNGTELRSAATINPQSDLLFPNSSSMSRSKSSVSTPQPANDPAFNNSTTLGALILSNVISGGSVTPMTLQANRSTRWLDEKCYQYVVGVEKLLSLKGFYFSYDCDLTRSLQAKVLTYKQTGMLDLPQRVPVWNSLYHEKQSIPLLKYSDDMFIWNSQLCKPFQEIDADPNWLVPCIQGSVSTSIVNASDSLLRLLLICRRSAYRGGMRYFARGIDDAGSVANFCESEFLSCVYSADSGCDNRFPNSSIHQKGGGWFSMTQVRGSVPLFWEQPTAGMARLVPVPKITRSKEFTIKAFGSHQALLHNKYGAVYYVNLLSSQKNGEPKLTQSLNEMLKFHHDEGGLGTTALAPSAVPSSPSASSPQSVDRRKVSIYQQRDITVSVADTPVVITACPVCSGGTGVHKTNHLHWDFHAQVKLKGFESALRSFSETKEVSEAQEAVGYYCQIPVVDSSNADNKNEIPKYQRGVLRTNCLDCLDRTNAMQWWFAWRWIARVLKDRNFSSLVGIEGVKLTQEAAEFIFSDYLMASALWMPVEQGGITPGTMTMPSLVRPSSTAPVPTAAMAVGTQRYLGANQSARVLTRMPSPPESEAQREELATMVKQTSQMKELSRHRSASSSELEVDVLMNDASAITSHSESLTNRSLTVSTTGCSASPPEYQILQTTRALYLPPPFPAGASLVNTCVLPSEAASALEYRSYYLTSLNDDFLTTNYYRPSAISSATRHVRKKSLGESVSVGVLPTFDASPRRQKDSDLSECSYDELDRQRAAAVVEDMEESRVAAMVNGNRRTDGVPGADNLSLQDKSSTEDLGIAAGVEEMFSQTKTDVLRDIVSAMWADQGDLLSLEYTGTGSVLSPLLKAGKASLFTNLAHFKRTMGRLYQNTFEDKTRQECIDFLLNAHRYSKPYTTRPPSLSYHTYAARSKLAPPPAAPHFGTPGSLDRRMSKDDKLVDTPGTALSALTYSGGKTAGEMLGSVRKAKSAKVWIGSWNVAGGGKSLTDGFAEWFSGCVTGSSEPQAGRVEIVADIYVVCLQEIVELSSYRSWWVQVDKDKETLIAEQVLNCLGPSFISLASGTLMGLHIGVFIKSSLARFVSRVEHVELKLGIITGQIGNKGAILIRFLLGETSLCFGNVHFASGANKADERKQQLEAVTSAVFSGCKMSPTDHSYFLLGGDFNFRTDADIPQIESWLMSGAFDDFLRRDQFVMSKKQELFPFTEYNEVRVSFWPTYKYKKNTSQYDRCRAPGWCDRVLYGGTMTKKVSDDSKEKDGFLPIKYDRVRKCFSSDHKPVYLLAKIRCYFERAVTSVACQSPLHAASSRDPSSAGSIGTPPDIINRDMTATSSLVEAEENSLIDLGRPDFIPNEPKTQK